MRSMPGVPSATPAHEKSACTGPPHSSRAASIDAVSARFRRIALTPGNVTSARSITTTSAPASCTNSATAAPMPVAPPTTSARLPSYRNASNRPMCFFPSRLVSGDDAADLEVHDRVPIEAERAKDGVAVLVELGGALGRRRFAVELHRRGRELERSAVGRLAVDDVAVGDGLGVGGRFEGVLHGGPLPAELGEAL